MSIADKVENNVQTSTVPIRPIDDREQHVTQTTIKRFKELREKGDVIRASSRSEKKTQRLDDISDDPDYSDCNIRWKRVHPKNCEQSGIALVPQSRDMMMPLAKWSSVCENIRDVCGGGQYRVEVYNSGSQTILVLECTIDSLEFPPKNPPNTTAYPNIPGTINGSKVSTEVADQVRGKIKRAEQAAELEHTMKMETLEDQREDRVHKREQREKDRREDSSKGKSEVNPVMAMVLDSIKSTNENMMRMMEKINTPPPLPPPQDNTMVIALMKMMSDQTASQAATQMRSIEMQIEQSKNPKDDAVMPMFMKLQQETTKLLMTSLNAPKTDGLLEKVLPILIGNLKSANSSGGMKEAFETLGMAKGLLLDGIAPQMDVDADPPSAFASIINQLGAGLGQGLANKISGLVPEQPAAPVDQQQPLLPESNGSTEVVFDNPQPANAPIVTPPPPTQQTVPDPSTPEGRLFLVMSELMRVALKDMQAESRQHNWIEPAIENLPEGVLDKISNIGPDAESEVLLLDTIKPYCNKAVFDEILKILGDGSKYTACYVQFYSSWNQVKELHLERKRQDEQGPAA